MFDFTGKKVLVTGVSKGTGASIAYGFADAGARVALLSHPKEKLQTVRDSHPNLVDAPMYTADVRDEWALGEVFFDLKARFGGIDVLVNNAGGRLYTSANESGPNAFASVLNINLLGPLLVSKAAYPLMAESGGGVIINIGSIADRDSSKGMVVYGAAKAGLVNMTRTLAAKWESDGIRVNTIAPEPMLTDVIDTVLYLASSHASFINGTTLHVDGESTIPLQRR